MKLKEGFEFIDSIEELSAMPSIALDIMKMLNDPSSSVHSIVEESIKMSESYLSIL